MLGEATTAALGRAAGRRRAAAAAAVLLFFPTSYAGAEPAPAPAWREFWAGADVSGHVWLAYSGVTVAPYSGMFDDGLRLRAASGYGGYTYAGPRDGKLQAFEADTTFGDALVGYLSRLGPLTAKAFVGIAAIDHAVRPLDPDNPVQGFAFGPKGVAEFWLNLGEGAWSSLDVSWTERAPDLFRPRALRIPAVCGLFRRRGGARQRQRARQGRPRRPVLALCLGRRRDLSIGRRLRPLSRGRRRHDRPLCRHALAHPVLSLKACELACMPLNCRAHVPHAPVNLPFR